MNELTELAKQLPEVLKEIYGDLAKPGVQQAGKAMETVVGFGNTLLWPLAMLNGKAKISLESNLEKYRKKMQEVPLDEVCEVAPEVGVPIAEKLSYVTNEELSEMYVELLAKASQKQKSNMAHPSFVNIINNISPDEAVYLKSIKDTIAIPFIEVRLMYEGENKWDVINSMLMSASCLNDLIHPNNISAYMNNFFGQGILSTRQDQFLAQENIYEPLEEFAKNVYMNLSVLDKRSLIFARGKIDITPFGRLFMSACFK